MKEYLVKLMTDAGFIHEIYVKIENEDGVPELNGFRQARSILAKANPGIGNLHFFAIEEGILNVGWLKEKAFTIDTMDPMPFEGTRKAFRDRSGLKMKEDVTFGNIYLMDLEEGGTALALQWDSGRYGLSNIKTDPHHFTQQPDETFDSEEKMILRVKELLGC